MTDFQNIPSYDPQYQEEIKSMAGDQANSIIAELMQLFDEEANDLFKELEECLAQNTCHQQACDKLHAIKSSSGNLGFTRFSHICAELEVIAPKIDAKIIALLKDEYSHIRQKLAA